jgi:hypothetical protein
LRFEKEHIGINDFYSQQTLFGLSRFFGKKRREHINGLKVTKERRGEMYLGCDIKFTE